MVRSVTANKNNPCIKEMVMMMMMMMIIIIIIIRKLCLMFEELN